MKVLYLNVLGGCKEPDRFNALISFINRENPDFLGLSELNGWDEYDFAKLSAFSKRTGFRFSAFCKSRHGYHMALFSRYRLENVRVMEKGFWHGAIVAKARAKGDTYTLALTHLCPISEELRIKEVSLILRKIGKKGNTILMGDMNSLSPLDKINEPAILRVIRSKKITKFGNGKLRKETIGMILKSGFSDTLAVFPSASSTYSVPTKYNKDPAHFAKLHLDYIFVSGYLRKRLKSSHVLNNRITNRLSDHYPVVASFAV